MVGSPLGKTNLSVHKIDAVVGEASTVAMATTPRPISELARTKRPNCSRKPIRILSLLFKNRLDLVF